MKTNNCFSYLLMSSMAGIGIANPCQSFGQTKDMQTKAPNVILVLTDDQGYGDLTVNGNPILKTPNLDILHGQSIRFTDFHVAPMCSPTRGQIMTGRDALDNGATAVCMGRSMVREDLPTMADIFRTTGYNTVHFGKWHMGDSYPYRPQDRGFDETVHHNAFGIGSLADYYGNTYWDGVFEHNGKTEKYDGYCTDVWFSLAKEYIKRNKKSEKPFFMYLATNAAHAPHLCDDKYSDPYKDKVGTLQEAKFFGQIANIDENMGKLMSLLKETRQADNTILIYMTDNGSSRGYDVFNAGMRGHKTEPYEGGHRVPLFIRWPNGGLGNPRDINELTQCQDLLPTLIELCNLKNTNDDQFDGISLVPLFKGKTKKFTDRKLVVEYENPYKPKENLAVLWGKWRLVMHEELYNLSTDPAQKSNIAGQHPEVVKVMQDYYQNWQKQTLSDYNKVRYIHLGNDRQNPLMLYSSDWSGSYADNTGNLISANAFGKWYVNVDTKGLYEITLYRWHPGSGLAINAPMLDKSGKIRGAIPIGKGRLKIGEFDETINIADGQTEVKFTLPLETGKFELQTWFEDSNEKLLCSAFYTKVELFKK